MSLYGLTGGSAGESESGVGFHFWVGGELVALVDLGQFLFCIWRSPPYPPYIFLFPTGSRPAVSLAGWLMGQSDGRSDGLSESYQRLNGSWLYCQLAFWNHYYHQSLEWTRV